MIYSSSRIVFFDAELSRHVSHVKDTVCKLANALDELSHGLQRFNELQLNKTVAIPLLHKVYEMTTTTKNFRDQLSALVDDVKLTAFSLLLDRTCHLSSASP
jgi:hypothetical protein